MYESLLQHAKEHEMKVKDFNRHKSNGGTVIATTVDEIRTFKYKKGNSGNTKISSGKACSKCSTLPPLRECPAFGKKCHKCDISAFVVGQNKRASEMAAIKDHPEVGAQRDITDLKVDAPDWDQGHEVPTALSSMMTKEQLRKCSIPFTDPNWYLASRMRQI